MNYDYEFHSAFNDTYDIQVRKIIRFLSEDARISVSDLSKKVGVSRVTAIKKLKHVEKTFDIRYTLELNEAKLGIDNPHLVMIKFGKKPDYDKIAEILAKSYVPQVAVATKGDYDMIIYAVTPISREYANWDKAMQIALSKYGATWQSSWAVHKQLGYFPVRNELIDQLAIKEKYKNLLKVLNENSRATFQEISKKLGIHFNTVAYTFEKMIKSGYIERATISMAPPKGIVFMSFFSKYSPREGYEESSALARKAFLNDDRFSLVSRYLVCAPLVGSYDFFTLGAFDSYDSALKHDINYHKSVLEKHKVEVKFAYLDKVILGRLPIRSIDAQNEYKLIRWRADFTK